MSVELRLRSPIPSTRVLAALAVPRAVEDPTDAERISARVTGDRFIAFFERPARWRLFATRPTARGRVRPGEHGGAVVEAVVGVELERLLFPAAFGLLYLWLWPEHWLARSACVALVGVSLAQWMRHWRFGPADPSVQALTRWMQSELRRAEQSEPASV